MYSRLVAVLAVALAGVLVPATAASASIRFDPATGTGYVGGGDVRTAYRWTGAMLRVRAAGLTFSHSTSIEDTYDVFCGSTGQAPVEVTHLRQSARVELGVSVDYDAPSGYGAGRRGGVAGFRLTGAVSGISGTTVGPAVGAPCPAARAAADTIKKVRLKSTATTSVLAASYQGVDRDLLVRRT
ncbi:hypothetical protein ACIBSW_38335 [Actinoplanes sp. NPDC049668]|uniref:hypothetical protein n=1 Tax=unclassified Actinoplanes TaxID=2626549 RepID=UPI0033A835DC